MSEQSYDLGPLKSRAIILYTLALPRTLTQSYAWPVCAFPLLPNVFAQHHWVLGAPVLSYPGCWAGNHGLSLICPKFSNIPVPGTESREKKMLSNSSPDHISPCIFKCVGHCSPSSQEWTFQPWKGNADLLSSRSPVPLGCVSHSACVCPRHWPCLTLTSHPWKDKRCFHKALSSWTFQSVVSTSHTCGVPVGE